ncbi:MAG: septation regulator SpoVG [Oscillospiraceae bacterium]|nr:septation regulator SpoVG [Oscillospiraceae bacterium]
MQISDIRVRRTSPHGRLRAVISLTIDDAVAIHDIKLIQGEERLFVAMPSRRNETGSFRDIIHPINPEARAQIEEAVLKAYQEHLEEEQRVLEFGDVTAPDENSATEKDALLV